MNDTPAIDAPLLLGMMRLHETPALHAPGALADWLEARLEQGLRWFDHADHYGDRAGETLFGDALRTRPDLARRVRVVTRAGGPPSRAIDAALRRLGVERLDHFLLHRPDPSLDAEATGRALDDAIAAGKIGAAGVSHCLPEAWRRLQAAMHHRLAVHQLSLSLARLEPLFDGRYDALVGDGQVPVIWSPLGGGRVMTSPARPLLLQRADALGVTPAGLALAWLRALPGRPVPVIGSLRPERIDALQRDASLNLSAADWQALLEAARGHEVTPPGADHCPQPPS